MNTDKTAETPKEARREREYGSKAKRGRPYKNQNLVPQGLADYIRKLEKENADLKTQIEQSKADNEDS